MFIFYLIFVLALPDLSPVYEAVAVIDKKHREAEQATRAILPIRAF